MKKELIKTFLIIAIFIINTKIVKSDEISTADLFLDNILIISTSLLYFLMLNILKIFSKPIKISVSLTNSSTGKNETPYYHYGNTREDIKTITLKIDIERTCSTWNRIALYLIRDKKFDILICSQPESQSMVCQPCSLNDNIEIINSGFRFNIVSLVKSNLENRVPLNSNINFLVQENRDYQLQSNQQIPIKPILLLNHTPMKFFHKLFYKYEYEGKEEFHIVEYIK